MQEPQVERFRKRARFLHWTIAVSAAILALTGLFLYVPAFGMAAQDGYTRVIHRIAAIVFIVMPLIYLVWTPRSVGSFIKDAFSYGSADWEWAKKAPDYYFGGDESKMPPQGHVNAGQKLYMLCALVCGIGLTVTGLMIWFGGSVLWMAFVHDLFFIIFLLFTAIHVYLGALHPHMTESLRSMITGKAPVEYLKHHYGKWYDEEFGESEAVVGEGQGEQE